MRSALAPLVTALAAIGGGLFLAPPALSGEEGSLAGLAPLNAQLQLEAARASWQASEQESSSLAAGFAHRALLAHPYNQPALAIAIEANGVSEPVKAANIAAALGWRDTLANRRIARLALASDNMPVAAQRVDAIGRTRGGAIAAAAADTILSSPGGPEAMAARANLGPGSVWWIVYLRRPATSPEAQIGRLTFARALDLDNGKWLRDLVVAISGSMEGPDAAGDAYALWRDTLAGGESGPNLLYDGNFTQFAKHQPAIGGEWRQRASSPYAAEYSGEGLVLTPVRQSTGPIIAQQLQAEPGSYQLTSTAEDGASGLQWRVQCGEGAALLATESVAGQWSFTIPDACPNPYLVLAAEDAASNDQIVRIAKVAIEATS